MNHSHPYWLDIKAITGETSSPEDNSIVIIGSGLAGSSAAYFLYENGFEDITVVDFEPEKAATFRNCGHILYGTVESMQALVALHGRDLAQKIWRLSIDICHEVRETVNRLGLEVDYHQDGYLVVSIDETEDKEILESISLLNSMDFQSRYLTQKEVEALGFRNVFGGRFEEGSAQAHPVKFRNGVLAEAIRRGAKYHSNCKVTKLEEVGDYVELTHENGKAKFDAAVICANAYSPLFSDFFAEHTLVDPFRGQIITSAPLREKIPVSYPHSFDHGYEYALATADNRLIIGGWRNNTEGGETGTYDITPNPQVEEGLKQFVRDHYSFQQEPTWEYSWAGIMATSKTAFPFIGPTSSQRIYTCAGFTGHGFSWAHGSAKLLADIMAGNPIPDITHHFTPKLI